MRKIRKKIKKIIFFIRTFRDIRREAKAWRDEFMEWKERMYI